MSSGSRPPAPFVGVVALKTSWPLVQHTTLQSAKSPLLQYGTDPFRKPSHQVPLSASQALRVAVGKSARVRQLPIHMQPPVGQHLSHSGLVPVWHVCIRRLSWSGDGTLHCPSLRCLHRSPAQTQCIRARKEVHNHPYHMCAGAVHDRIAWITHLNHMRTRRRDEADLEHNH